MKHFFPEYILPDFYRSCSSFVFLRKEICHCSVCSTVDLVLSCTYTVVNISAFWGFLVYLLSLAYKLKQSSTTSVCVK